MGVSSNEMIKSLDLYNGWDLIVALDNLVTSGELAENRVGESRRHAGQILYEQGRLTAAGAGILGVAIEAVVDAYSKRSKTAEDISNTAIMDALKGLQERISGNYDADAFIQDLQALEKEELDYIVKFVGMQSNGKSKIFAPAEVEKMVAAIERVAQARLAASPTQAPKMFSEKPLSPIEDLHAQQKEQKELNSAVNSVSSNKPTSGG